MSLGSAPVPPLGPRDRVRGRDDGPVLIVYGDYECPFCAALDQRLAAAPVPFAFRHFPVRASHPRAHAAACAAEAAAEQGAFWAMHDALFADQAHLEDPHLWRRAEALGLDLERFDADRRSEAVMARVKGSLRAAIRAGVVTTPTLVVEGELHPGRPDAALWARITGA